jgi:hypothetical protein
MFVGVLTRNLCFLIFTSTACCVQDLVDKLHLTTADVYTVLQPSSKKKLFKCSLADPQYPLPTNVPSNMEDMPVLGDYVEVDASSIRDLQTAKKKYKYDAEGLYILTKDWQCFDEEMTVEDLMGADNFLLYYQDIDQTASVCKVKPTAREAKAKNLKRKR